MKKIPAWEWILGGAIAVLLGWQIVDIVGALTDLRPEALIKYEEVLRK